MFFVGGGVIHHACWQRCHMYLIDIDMSAYSAKVKKYKKEQCNYLFYLVRSTTRRVEMKIFILICFMVSHPEFFEFQDVIKIKNKTTIFS